LCPHKRFTEQLNKVSFEDTSVGGNKRRNFLIFLIDWKNEKGKGKKNYFKSSFFKNYSFYLPF
jgi:hypothetical protein